MPGGHPHVRELTYRRACLIVSPKLRDNFFLFIFPKATDVFKLIVRSLMAAYILDFDPAIHLKVRHNEQLYVVFLKEFDFFHLPPHAEVVIHLISRDRIIYHEEKAIQQLYSVKKRELIIVEPHVEE